METVVAVVGIMLTKQVAVPKGTPEEMQRAIVAALTDGTGQWELDQFKIGEACIKLALVEAAPRRPLVPRQFVAMLPLAMGFALGRLAVLGLGWWARSAGA